MVEESPKPKEKLPYELQNGEKIMIEVRPGFFGFVMMRVFAEIAGLVLLAIIIMVALFEFPQYEYELLLAICAFILIAALLMLGPIISYGKYKYWITNHRVIGRRGVIGYSIDSIPLENVTDVVINRSLLERVLNIASLIIVPMGGTPRTPENVESANYFPALRPHEAVDLQKLIFNLRDKRKEETGKVL